MPIPKLVVTAGLMIAQVALGMTKKIKGPRLEDLSVTLADYGTPIPRLWGKRRINPQIIWAKPLHEVKHRRKTKGGKYTDYKYFGSWAALICDHEIDAVSRIWFDKKLVYDMSGTGPVSVTSLIEDGLDLVGGGNMRIYLGTETQMPDPLIEAWCDDRYGADSCPAYRGSAYIVFEEIPLEQVGNRIPQITVEAINNKTDVYPTESHATDQSNGADFALSPNWMAYYSTSDIEWWDLPHRQKLGTSTLSAVFGTTSADLASDGTWYMYGSYISGVDVIRALWSCPPLGASSVVDLDPFASVSLVRTRAIGTSVLCGTNGLGYISGTSFVDTTQSPRDFFIDDLDEIWAVTQPTGTSSGFGLYRLSDGDFTTFTGSVSRAGVTTARACYVSSTDSFFVVTDGVFYIIPRATMTVSATGTAAWGSDDILPIKNPERSTIWHDFSEYSLVDGSLIRTVSGWTAPASHRDVYDPINHAVISRPQFEANLYWLYIDRVDSSGVTLQTVVDDVSGWCGLTGQDSSALTQIVLGYSVTQGSGKDMIAPLLDIHDVDARPHDFSVQFKVRGSAPSGSILTEDFVRNGDRYKVTIQQDTDLPREVTFNFADNDHDQQSNNVKSVRPVAATSSSRSETIDLTTYADTPDSAQQKADRYQRRLWNSRERTSLSLTAQKLALEPGDVTTISLDGAQRNVRLDKMTIAGSQIDCEFVRDETAFATLNSATTGPTMDGRDPEVIFIPANTRGFVMDIPLIRDADNDANPVLYIAAGGYSDPWPGAFFVRGDDGTYDEEFATLDTSSEATWGLTTDALADADPNLWDRGNSVNVNILNGTPLTVTEAEIDADPSLNLAALGNVTTGYELINFTTATLETDGTYTLSGFKRGRRGTDAVAHVAGDEFVLLNHAAIENMGADDLGAAMSFKAASAGRDPDASPAIDLTYSAASLKPYAPARIKWTTDGTDMFGEIIRRTRVGGSWVGGTTIPLSENSEAYEVDIYHLTTFKRTITVTDTNLFTYTAAQIAADGNTVGVAPPVNAYQMSDTVGRGFALAA
jgi:hypothetical protein